MRRTYDRGRFLDRVALIREHNPDIALTTDIIVGFPGETEEDFAETLEVCEEVGFDGAFTFIYSPRRDTEAADSPRTSSTTRSPWSGWSAWSRWSSAGPRSAPSASWGARSTSWSRARRAPTRRACAVAVATARRSTSRGWRGGRDRACADHRVDVADPVGRDVAAGARAGLLTNREVPATNRCSYFVSTFANMCSHAVGQSQTRQRREHGFRAIGSRRRCGALTRPRRWTCASTRSTPRARAWRCILMGGHCRPVVLWRRVVVARREVRAMSRRTTSAWVVGPTCKAIA